MVTRRGKAFEYRSALSPKSAEILIQKGVQVVVEKSMVRIFDDQLYADVGCQLVEAGSWKTQAPKEAYILGLKELEEQSTPLKPWHSLVG